MCGPTLHWITATVTTVSYFHLLFWSHMQVFTF
uniref:Uncharacterized protein n=1 Tax=Arundo donax TaxID=35708 RepID=A0A0A9C3Y2_ARUDO